MKIEEIEKLLADFYEGGTSEEQEEWLRSFFVTQEVPRHLQPDKEMFLSFRASYQTEVPVGLETKLSRLIDEKAREERKFFLGSRSKRNRIRMVGIAASILLFIGLGYGIIAIENVSRAPKCSISDPQEAYRVIQTALVEVSTNLNDGIYEIAETQKEMKKIDKEISKEIYPIRRNP